MILENTSIAPPSEICKDCGGMCCKRMPGTFSPTQFTNESGHLDRKKIILSLMSDGCAQLDKWDKDWNINDDVYFLRARAINDDKASPFTASWGGQCILLDESTGCKLPMEGRPLECQILVPKRNKCIIPRFAATNDKLIFAIEWIPYQAELARIIEEQWPDVAERIPKKVYIDSTLPSDLSKNLDLSKEELDFILALSTTDTNA